MKRSVSVLLPLLGSLAAAQEFVPTPHDVTVVPSSLFQGAQISYKKTSVCETTEGVNAYAGYVKLPKNLLQDASEWADDLSANLFFWYFEARNDPEHAPTSMYLGGGPGSSSLDSASDFPCFFNPDGNSTRLNEFSWNNNVNMLYIDQPVRTGFSYVTLANGTYDYLTQVFTPAEALDDLPELNVTLRQATLDAGAEGVAPNNTMDTARTMWTFSQVWFNEFPEWQTDNDEISLWAYSYGGFYGPAVFEYTLDQNKRIENGEHLYIANATTLKLATLGLSDSCVDAKSLGHGYPEFARNNTYGLQIYSEDVYNEVMEKLNEPETGCYALIDTCRALAEEGDPDSFGANQTVNAACVDATMLCFLELQGAYSANSDRSVYDVTRSNATVQPTPYMGNFFNNRWVQQDLGVPLNFTTAQRETFANFAATGDLIRRTSHSLEKVLAGGVNVALANGDRDYRCNWFAVENASLTLAFDGDSGFQSAGYAPLVTNDTYQGGLSRQHGALSFSRIFQAGHGSSAWQPETMSKLFERAMFGLDVATGEVDLSSQADYATTGLAFVNDVGSEVPQEALPNVCLVRETLFSCTSEQAAALADGSAVVEDFVVLEPKGAPPAPLNSTNQGSDGDGDDASDSTDQDQGRSNNETNAGSKGAVSGLGSAVVAMLALASFLV